MISIEQLYEVYKEHPIITTDSRSCPKDSIFIALKGDNFDGNKFAQQTLDSGCAYAVVDDPQYAVDPRILLVEDGLKCLQELARYHRKQLKDIPVICVTGTNGKTTTKELIANVLMKKYKVLYTQGNFNNHIGVPLTLLKLDTHYDLAIIEMGANHPGEINTLVNIAQPNYGIITNVGKAHLAGFGSFEGILRTKGELYDYLREHPGKIFINAQNKYLMGLSKGLEKIAYRAETEAIDNNSNQEDRIFSAATSCIQQTAIQGKVIENAPYLKIQWTTDNGQYEAQTHLIGAYNLENALAAICVGDYFQVSANDIQTALETYQPNNNRSQLKKTAHNTLIIDAYNANPTSMNAAIDNFIDYPTERKAVILGGMRELGTYSEDEHANIIKHLETQPFYRIYLIGEEFENSLSKMLNRCPENDKRFFYFETTASCKSYLHENPLENTTILLKGSRGNQLEQLIEEL